MAASTNNSSGNAGADSNAGNSSSIRAKKSGGSPLLKIALIAVVAFVAYHFYTEWVHTESVESAEQLRTELLQATAQYKNDEGYVSEADADAYQQAAYKCIQNYKGDRISSKGKTEHGVWVKFDDGMTMFLNPPMEDYLSVDVAKRCVINTYKPHTFPARCDPYIAIIDGNADIFAGEFANANINATTYSSVTLAAVKNMGAPGTQQIILWSGHGAYDSEDGSLLWVAEKVNWNRLKKDADYYKDFTEGRLGYDAESEEIAVTAKFIKKYVKNLDGALVYLGSCESGRDSRLADAFIGAGAETVIGYSKDTRVTYHAELSQAFAQTMVMRNANGDYPNVVDAMAAATEHVGADDSSKGGVGSKPMIFGSRSFSLKNSKAASGAASAAPSGTSSAGPSSGSSSATGQTGSTSSSASAASSAGANAATTVTTAPQTPATPTAPAAPTAPSASAGNAANTGNDAQTAPMPESVITEDQLIGYWSPDINTAEPIIVQFYKENGQLKYHHYRVLLGDGGGHNIDFERTGFEFTSGYVEFWGNQGRCNCVNELTGTSRLGFYLFDIDKGVIDEQATGERYYRVE